MIPNLRSLRFRPNVYCPDGGGFWSGHLPFAADIIDALRPSMLVELGTHQGESYFGFCQAIAESSLHCQCYAVDTWRGDLHTGPYPPSVFKTVSEYNARHYESFSHLLRMTFDEAACLFLDGSLDLLHIDGCHSYSAVKHDFETWLPKVAKGGLIVMHDIAVQRDDFGVWRFWAEIQREFPSFAFWHSSGLGVLAHGSVDTRKHPLLSALFGRESDPRQLRDYYFLCAESLSHRPLRKSEEISKFQVYSPDESGYSHVRSHVTNVRLNDWVVLDLDVPFSSGRLRVDPCETASLIEVLEIAIQDPAGNLLWRLDPARPTEIDCGGTAARVCGNDVLTIVSFGNDPQLFLPHFETPAMLETLRLQCRLRIDPGFSSAAEAFRDFAASLSQANHDIQQQQRLADELRGSITKSAEELQHEHQRHEQQANEWVIQREALEAENNDLRAALINESEKLEEEREGHRQHLNAWTAQRQAFEAEANGLRASIVHATAELQEERRRNGEQRAQDQFTLASAEKRSASLQRTIESVRNSKSWRLTSPLRVLGDAASKAHQVLLKALYQSPAFPFTGKLLAKTVYACRLPGATILLPLNPLFSSDFYTVSNPDISKTRSQWAHYIGFGADERRNPHPLFDTRYYMERNPDVVKSGLNPLIHYYSSGATEFRQPHPEFDPLHYLRFRGDVQESRMNPLLHYWEYGRYEQAPLDRVNQDMTGSSREETPSVPRDYAAQRDSRIDIHFGAGNSGPSRAPLDPARADYIGMQSL